MEMRSKKRIQDGIKYGLIYTIALMIVGITYYDKSIIGQIAEKSGLSQEYIQESAELAPKKGLLAYALAGRDITGTMMNFAFQGTDYEPLAKHLEGPNAVAISKDDATAPARIISKYAKKAPTLKMIAGVVEGNYYDEKGVAALATVPSREELLGKLLGSIQSPITNLARVLNQIAESKTETAAE